MKFLKMYDSLDDVLYTSNETPYIGKIRNTNKVIYGSNNKYGDTISLVRDVENDYFKVASVPDNEIWYTSSNNKTITPILGHMDDILAFHSSYDTYTDGLGKIGFDYALDGYNGGRLYVLSSTDSQVTSIILPDSIEGTVCLDGFNYLREVNLTNKTTEISFYNCSALEHVTIPNSVTTICLQGFRYCGSLKSINIPDSVTSIGNNAFENCTSLKSIVLSQNVTKLSYAMFRNCSSLESIVLPSSISIIDEDDDVFSGCVRLRNVVCENLNVHLDFSDSTNMYNADCIQKIIDTMRENGKITFSSRCAKYLKGELVLGSKAHWEGNSLVYGEGDSYYGYRY